MEKPPLTGRNLEQDQPRMGGHIQYIIHANPFSNVWLVRQFSPDLLPVIPVHLNLLG